MQTRLFRFSKQSRVNNQDSSTNVARSGIIAFAYACAPLAFGWPTEARLHTFTSVCAAAAAQAEPRGPETSVGSSGLRSACIAYRNAWGASTEFCGPNPGSAKKTRGGIFAPS